MRVQPAEVLCVIGITVRSYVQGLPRANISCADVPPARESPDRESELKMCFPPAVLIQLNRHLTRHRVVRK